MSTVEPFEDLVVWQKGRLLTDLIYQYTRQGAFAKDFGTGQMQRAAVSVVSNIAEDLNVAAVTSFINACYSLKPRVQNCDRNYL